MNVHNFLYNLSYNSGINIIIKIYQTMKTFKFGESKIYLHENDLPKNIEYPKVIAIDTETTGLSLVRDRLCLIQFCFLKTMNAIWLNSEKIL